MLNKQHRFHGYNIVKRIYTRSQTINGKYISLKYSRRNGNRSYRVAVVVGRKVSKSAVTRNKIRRRIFESLRQKQKIPESYDLIFNIYNDKVNQLSEKDISENIKNLLVKVK